MTSLMALSTPEPAPWRYRLVTKVAFICAMSLLAMPFRTTIAVVGLLHRWLPLADLAATDLRLRRLVSATALTGRYWPGRVACIEVSLTLVLAAAFTGLRLHWCLGGRFDPPATHAWARTSDGVPVGESEDTPWPWNTALCI